MDATTTLGNLTNVPIDDTPKRIPIIPVDLVAPLEGAINIRYNEAIADIDLDKVKAKEYTLEELKGFLIRLDVNLPTEESYNNNLHHLLVSSVLIMEQEETRCTSHQLRSALDIFGLSSDGSKDDLIYRLRTYLAYQRSIDIENMEKYTREELCQYLRNLGLPKIGTKKILLKRITNYFDLLLA